MVFTQNLLVAVLVVVGGGGGLIADETEENVSKIKALHRKTVFLPVKTF